MLTEKAAGVYVIAATPFNDDGRIDEASTDRMVEFYRGCGVTGLTILGMMGEAPKLDTAEAIEFSRRVVKRAGGLPVVVGVSAPGFAAMRSLSRAVMDAGAAGVMIAPPGNVRTDDQVPDTTTSASPRSARTCRSSFRIIRWRVASSSRPP